MGWDGMGWDGTVIKSVLQFYSYIVGIHNTIPMYISTYIGIKKMSPTFLWVSKFDVNLGVKSKFSKSLCVGDFSIFGSKNSLVHGVILTLKAEFFILFVI